MEPEVTAVVLASEPGSLVRLCGVSMLDRHLRVLQRLGFSTAIIWNATPEVKAELETVSSARDKIRIEFISDLAQRPGPFLIISGSIYCESRVLAALLKCSVPTVTIDTNPPKERLSLLNGTQRFQGELVCGARWADSFSNDLNDSSVLDVARLPAYIGSIRRTIHPLWFPAPSPENLPLAENLILNAATKGTPDFPAILHAPIETWATRHLCPTRITPNQLTFFTGILGILITIQFVRGHWWSGLLMAVAFGILDGVDGKLARVKVETTELGKLEHYLDHAFEYSWWLAIAWALGASGQLQHAWLFGVLVIAGDLLGKIVTRPVMAHTGKPSHDFSRFEQRLRLIGGRRNIYIVMLLIGLLGGQLALAFAAIGCWSMMTAAIQPVRSIYICCFTPRLV